MTKAIRYARTSALPAIAAVLALSSTTSLAQQAQPTPSEPTTTTPPVTAAPSTPAPDEASPVAQTPSNSPDSSAASTTAPASSPRTAPVKTSRSRAVARRAAAATAPIAHTVIHKSHSATASKSSAPPAPPVAPPPAAAMAAKAPAQSPASAKPSNRGNDTALEIGGGVLAILALGGAAVAIARRRRHEDEDEWYEEHYEENHGEPAATAEEPVEAIPVVRQDPIFEPQPALVAPEASAFSWGDSKEGAAPSGDGSDRRPGETWVERAYRGPSPANPSVSLRNRLRRAAFFDKREREVAEGRAEPVEAGAGLPDGRSGDRVRELA